MNKPAVFASGHPLEPLPAHIAAAEEALGMALQAFASELRLADAAGLAAFIHLGQTANLRSVVQSSAELHFKPGTLELAEPGDLELGWFAPPLVTLPMAFCHKGVRVYFRLRLAAISAAVEVESIAVDKRCVSGEVTSHLRRALEDACAIRRAASPLV
jgi:hypothetical protein